MNKVIIIGGDHYNALGLVRCFGINGIKPDGILTEPNVSSRFCNHSKFWNTVKYVTDENEAYQYLLTLPSCDEKPVLVPSSDGAMLMIDAHNEELSKKFILPGFKNNPGMVAHLMNKYNQMKWANNLGIETAKTWMLNLNDYKNLLSQFVYPCIVKPVISSEGHKSDIRKCDDEKSLISAIDWLKLNGYKRILVQEFLVKDYECELWGCIPQFSDKVPYLLSKHLREWPKIAGSVSCHEFIVEPAMKRQAEEILQKLKAGGYVGNVDIEILSIKGKLYLNEVNFRNSGDVYALFKDKVYYPYYSYLDMIGQDISGYNMEYTNDSYAMNETTDIRHALTGGISLFTWLKFLLNSEDKAYWFKGDMKPALYKYKYFVAKIIRQLFMYQKLKKLMGGGKNDLLKTSDSYGITCQLCDPQYEYTNGRMAA